MELELDLGSDNCSDATSDSDESGATSSDTEPAVAFGSPTRLEPDLGDIGNGFSVTSKTLNMALEICGVILHVKLETMLWCWAKIYIQRLTKINLIIQQNGECNHEFKSFEF